MSLWLFCTITVLLFLGAIALLYWGLWGDRSKGRMRCPKCWYDMSGSFVAGKLVCPECGKDAGGEKRLKKNHVRLWAMVVAVVLVTPHFYCSYVWYGWRTEQNAATEIENLEGQVGWKPVVPDTLLEWIPKPLHPYCNRVIKVKWMDEPVSDSVLTHVEGLPHLQELNLVRTKVTGAGMPHLQGLNKLKFIFMGYTRLTDTGLAHLKGMSQLQVLSIWFTQVTDDGLVHLQGMPELQWLDLSRTQVTDKGLVHLQGMNQLQQLYLSETKVTDAGLVHLKGLTKLKHLDLYNTQVTEYGVAELKKALPNCWIDY